MRNEKACFLYKIEKTFVLNLDLSTNTLFRFHFADEHGLQQKYDTDVYIIHTDEKSIVIRSALRSTTVLAHYSKQIPYYPTTHQQYSSAKISENS